MAIAVVSLGNRNTVEIHGPMERMDEADVVEKGLKEKHEEIY